jgi:hypothetical protein
MNFIALNQDLSSQVEAVFDGLCPATLDYGARPGVGGKQFSRARRGFFDMLEGLVNDRGISARNVPGVYPFRLELDPQGCMAAHEAPVFAS